MHTEEIIPIDEQEIQQILDGAAEPGSSLVTETLEKARLGRGLELNEIAVLMGINDPDLLNDPAVYPTNEEMKNAQLLLPLSPAGEKLHAEIWERFLAADN